jgi:dUTP pyrophosphatase
MKIKYNILFLNENEKKKYETKYLEKHNYIGDVGLDIYIMKKINVPANVINFKIKLGIKINAYRNDNLSSYMIFPRSSMGSKTPLRLCNSIGLVDSGYIGELIMIVDNISNRDYFIEEGDRLVQLVGPNHEIPYVEIVNKLEETNRNINGFGSTNYVVDC